MVGFSTTFLKHCDRGESLGSPTCPNTVVGGRQRMFPTCSNTVVGGKQRMLPVKYFRSNTPSVCQSNFTDIRLKRCDESGHLQFYSVILPHLIQWCLPVGVDDAQCALQFGLMMLIFYDDLIG